MSLLLLDTTFLIDAERGGVDIDEAIHDDDDVAIAAITVAELPMGVKLASAKRRKARRAYVDEVVESLPIIAMTTMSPWKTLSFSPRYAARAVRGVLTTCLSLPPPG